jgi:phosphoribosyl-AMP cyclohydrolase
MSMPTLDWKKLRSVAALSTEVLPVAVQDADSGQVLMVAYANRQAVEVSIERGEAAFWSTSTDSLHVKGATSGNVLELVDIRVNCEDNSLLYQVHVRGTGACHVADDDGNPHMSCFFRELHPAG